MSRVIWHQSSSITLVEIHRNSWNLLKTSADMFTSKPPFETAKNGDFYQRFRRGSKKDGSVYWAKWHILYNSIEISKMRLLKPHSCFIFKTKCIVQSATVASKK